jgi:SAM-dependent methyltransferase
MRILSRLVALLGVGLAFSATAQDEVPFVTTPDPVTLVMLQLAAVGPRDHVIDLGSGDGRIVITAAKRFGASGLGVEIVPDLVARSRELARTAAVHERVEFRQQDLFETDLRAASVVTMYLLPEVNLQLRPRLLALAPGTRIVSHDWNMGDWTPDRSAKVDAPEKTIGLGKTSQVHLWIVPAQVDGLWCAAGAQLDITQRFQQFSAALSGREVPAPGLVFDGRIEAANLRASGAHAITLQLDGDLLKLADTRAVPAAAGRTFRRAAGSRC